jgi:hypothetical protein
MTQNQSTASSSRTPKQRALFEHLVARSRTGRGKQEGRQRKIHHERVQAIDMMIVDDPESTGSISE